MHNVCQIEVSINKLGNIYLINIRTIDIQLAGKIPTTAQRWIRSASQVKLTGQADKELYFAEWYHTRVLSQSYHHLQHQGPK